MRRRIYYRENADVDRCRYRSFLCILDENLSKAQALKQSILKKAFAGQLVPQDPNDEPAEELLKRIRATQAAKRK